MDYASLNETIIGKVMAALAIINNPEIAPDVRQLNQEILFREVGAAVYEQVYYMNAFDFQIEHTVGKGIDDRYYGMANKASASVSTGNVELAALVRNYLDTMASSAQQDAVHNARQSRKFPTVERKMNGKTCKWCKPLAGNYENPDSEVFKRHRACDCQIITKGYKSRNGLLDNYVKTVEFNGKNRTVGELAREYNINPSTLRQRINRGSSPEQAVGRSFS